MKPVYILTEGGKNAGLGHITRCRSLYGELADRGLQVFFIVNGDSHAQPALNGLRYRLVNWLEADLNSFSGHPVIVDSYLASFEKYQEITAFAERILFIDDNGLLPYASLGEAFPEKPLHVVNPSLFGDKLPYEAQVGIRYLLGPKYIILRKPFRGKPPKQVRHTVASLTLTLGGADPLALTPVLVNELRRLKSVRKNVVLPGKSFGFENTALRDKETFFYSGLPAEEMMTLLRDSDLVISAGGQTCNELVQLSTPSILVQIADNQANNIKAMVEHGFATELQKEKTGDILSLIQAYDYILRKKQANAMGEYDFSQGAANIIDEFLSS